MAPPAGGAGTTAAAARAGMSRQRTAQKSIERVLGFVFTDSLSARRVLAPAAASATDLATSSSDWESVSANVGSEADREARARRVVVELVKLLMNAHRERGPPIGRRVRAEALTTSAYWSSGSGWVHRSCSLGTREGRVAEGTGASAIFCLLKAVDTEV